MTAIRAALTAGATLDSLAAPYGGARDSGPLTPGYPFVPGLGPEPRLVQQAFAAKVGVLSDTLQLTQGVAWYRVDEHGTGDPKLYETAQAQLTQELMKKNYDQWLDKKKQALRIEGPLQRPVEADDRRAFRHQAIMDDVAVRERKAKAMGARAKLAG